MKKILSKTVVACLLTLVLCFSEFSGGVISINTAVADGDGKMYIYFVPSSDMKKDDEGNLIPDESGKVTVDVIIDKPGDGVTLTVKTRDKSAIAEESDYVAQSKDIHLVMSASSTEKVTRSFTVQTNQTGAPNLILSGSSQAYGLTRIFEILICDIKTDSGCDYVVSNEYGKKEQGSTSLNARVQTQYDYEYEYSEKSGKKGVYFSDYLYGKSFSSAWFDRNGIFYQTPSSKTCVSVDNDSNYEYNPSFKPFIPYAYLLKYRKTGWADIYYGGSAIISESGWCTINTPATLHLMGDGGQTIFYSEYYDPKSDGAPILFGDTGYSNNNSDYRYYLTEKAKWWVNNNTGYTVINTDDPMYSHAYCYYTHKNYNFPSITGKIYKSNSENLNLQIKRDSTWKMNFEYLRVDSELYDTTSPQILKTSLSDLTTTDNKTLRLSVRFSEPVHLPTDLKSQENYQDLFYLTGTTDVNTSLKFVYSGGEGSDTLYFDCNLNDYTGSEGTFGYNSQIKSITFKASSAFSDACKNISDYAYNFSLKNNYVQLSSFEGNEFSVNIDMRKPDITTRILSDITSVAQKHIVYIGTDNMSAEGSKLYYTWVKTTDTESFDVYSESSYSNCETVTPTALTVTGEKLDGEYSLYYMAVSSYGLKTVGHTGAFKFDNTPVEISASLSNPAALLSEREVSLTLKGKAEDLKEILMEYRLKGETEKKTKVIYSADSVVNTVTLTYNEKADETTGKFTINGETTFGMEANQTKTFYLSFTTYDKANNVYEYDFDEPCLFDTSPRCTVNLTVSGTPYTVYDKVNVENTTINGSEESYKNSYFADNSGSKFSLTFSLDDNTTIELASLYKGDDLVTDTADKYFKCYYSDADKKTYVMEYSSDEGGYFSIQMKSFDKKSEIYSFYICGSEDKTDGYNITATDKLIVNKVWQAGDVSYYWMSENEIKKENYNSTKLRLAFSSDDKACLYYEFMEKQDLSLLHVDARIAQDLNSGVGENYRKATGEDKAVDGQTWIRYKSASWDQSNQTQNWNYYFYSNSYETEIDLSKLSDNLKSAIKKVALTITNKGGYVYLAEDDLLNAKKIPVLDSSRIKPNAESVKVTKTGNSFKTALYFNGDSGIYSPTYKTKDAEYPFAVQQLTVGEYTSFYFKKHDGNNYEKADVSGNFYLKDAINGTGIYDIIERDANGIREYSVYIDNDSPEISVSYDNNKGKQTLTIGKADAERNSSLNVKSFELLSVTDTDEYAYIALFNSGEVLKGVYFASDLSNASKSVSLDQGKYIIKVYDRSGNGFSFNLRISTESLADSCSVKNEPNNYIQFICTYSKDDIYRFEVYLDGVLLTDSVDSLASGKITFRDGGKYRFYVEDLFGNVYDVCNESTTLIRELPKVTWYYEKNDEWVKVADGVSETVGFLATKLGASSYSITTNGKVRFSFSEDYEYEFTLGSGTAKTVGSYTYVTIEGDNWQVKIYYREYPDLFVDYIGKSDSTAPTISLVTNRVKYSYADEDEEFVKKYLNGEGVKAGDRINFTDVSFIQTDVVTETVKDGELVTGSLVTLQISDSSGIYKWSYTYNGAVTEVTGGFTDKMVFGKEGSYVITATDKIGNTSTYSFDIGRTEFTELGVDDVYGIEKNYGNKNVVAKLYGAGEFVFIVNGEYYKLTTDGTNIKRTVLEVVENVETVDGVKKVTLSAEEKVTLNKELTKTPIVVGGGDDYSYYIKAFLSDGVVYLEVVLKEREETVKHTIDVKFSVRSTETVESKYTETELSDELSYLEYTIGDKKGTLDKTLYANDKVTLNITDEGNWYRFYYSKTDDFDSVGYTVCIGESECTEDGVYKIVVYNKYGNSSTVKIVYHVGISVEGTVVYLDGEKIAYSANYDEEFYSNCYVSLKVADTIGCSVKKNDEAYALEPDSQSPDGEKIFTVKGNGKFEFTFTDDFGNVETKTVFISDKAVEYSDEWLDGFNDKALRKSEGYTNTKVNFVKSKLLSDGIKSIIVTLPNGKTSSIYDDVSEEKLAFNEEFLIGNGGDGEYEIIFRDIYGNKTAKTVNYRSSSPLIVTRLTRSMDKQEYAVDEKVVENGVWCNKTITLSYDSSEASKTMFKVNSEERNLPFQLNFPSESNSGKYVYTVEYLDEYGFSYKFDCVLYRTTIKVEPYEMQVNEGITKDPVAVTFDDGYTATVSVNGEALGDYVSGTKYLQDGSYIISVKDVAGNLTNYSVKRDSVADFCFYVGTTEQKLFSGELVNEVVSFAPLNGDAVSYYTVYKDGREVEGYDSFSFTESGKWEILLKDEAGNKDYFCFYLVTHALSKFEYTTPEGFKITEVYYNSGGGKVDWTEAVEDKTDRSYLNFEEAGEYEVVMTSSLTGKTSEFSLVIDTSVPKIALSGVEDGGVTRENVKIGGLKEGDTVYIYKDGVLNGEIKVTTSSDVQEIQEKGNYKVVVVNEAGGTSQVEFTRVYTANVATSTLIIILIVAVVVGLFAGLLFRKRSRIE